MRYNLISFFFLNFNDTFFASKMINLILAIAGKLFIFVRDTRDMRIMSVPLISEPDAKRTCLYTRHWSMRVN